MRNRTVRTVLDALFRITEIASAPFTECIKRAVTKQTIKMFRIDTLVTGKEFAFPVAEKLIMVHDSVPPAVYYKSFGRFLIYATIKTI